MLNMEFKTANEEAIEANFIVDIQRIGEALQKLLNHQLPRNEPLFSFEKYGEGCTMTKSLDILGYKQLQIVIEKVFEPKNKKITFEIVCVLYGIKRLVINIPVSHREKYTKKEIERAKKSIITKVLEGLRKISA